MKPVLLDSVAHADLKYHKDTIPNDAFVPVIAPEIPACSDSLVIVFTNEETPRAVALLGRSKNVLIDKNYKGMVPSAIQNYPFFLAQVDGKMVVCLDEDAKQVKGDGEPLFVGGKPSPFLENLKNVLKNYYDLNALTMAAVKELKDAGVLEAKELNIEKDGENFTLLNGFLILNREKLLQLDDKKLAEFARKGYLELAFFHLKSLSNFQNLGDKIMAKDAPKTK